MSHGADYCYVCHKDEFLSTKAGGCSCSTTKVTTVPKVKTLKNQITKLHKEIEILQKACRHPSHDLSVTYGSNTGNYDPSADRWWIDYHCKNCDKKWSEDQ